MNNYRAIALANVETKILEKIILSKVVFHTVIMININLDLRRDILPPSVLVLSNRVLNITLIEAATSLSVLLISVKLMTK